MGNRSLACRRGVEPMTAGYDCHPAAGALERTTHLLES